MLKNALFSQKQETLAQEAVQQTQTQTQNANQKPNEPTIQAQGANPASEQQPMSGPGAQEAPKITPGDSLLRPSLPLYLDLVAKVVHRHVVRRDGYLLADPAAARKRGNGSSSEKSSGNSSSSGGKGRRRSGRGDAFRDKRLEQAFNVERYLPRKASKARCTALRLFGPVHVRREAVIVKAPAPTEAQVRQFLDHMNKALHPKHSVDDEKAATVITALIYLHRLMAERAVAIQSNNWRPLVCASLLAAVKFVCDGWNPCLSLRAALVDDAPISVRAINELEARFLQALRYQLQVTRTEYARMFFALRPLRDIASRKVPLLFVERHLGPAPASKALRESQSLKLEDVTHAGEAAVERVVRIQARPLPQKPHLKGDNQVVEETVLVATPQRKGKGKGKSKNKGAAEKVTAQVKSKLRLRASPRVLAQRRQKQKQKAEAREAEMVEPNSPSMGAVREERQQEIRKRVLRRAEGRKLKRREPVAVPPIVEIPTRNVDVFAIAGATGTASQKKTVFPPVTPLPNACLSGMSVMPELKPKLKPKADLFVDLSLKAFMFTTPKGKARNSGTPSDEHCKYLTPSDTTMRGSFDMGVWESPEGGFTSDGYARDGEYDTLWFDSDLNAEHDKYESDAGAFWGAATHQRLLSIVN